MNLSTEEKNQLEALIQLARRLAFEAHDGQLRQDGLAYITHPAAVAEGLAVSQGIMEQSPWAVDTRHFMLAIAVGWLHDVFEDCEHRGFTFDRFDELFVSVPLDIRKELHAALVAITKQDGEAYVDYLIRVLHNKIARTVKIEDISHNLSDHTDNRKNKHRREKYELALAVLEGRI